MYELENECCYRISFNPCGYMFAFTKEECAVQAEKSVNMQREMSVNAEILTTKDLKNKVNNIYVDDVLLTTYCRDDGLLNVDTLLGLLKQELNKMGVKIFCRKTVCDIETQNGHICKVVLEKEEIKTSIIVSAAGPWSKQIGNMLDINIPI